MQLYGAIEKVEPQDDGTVRVHGIATSETVDNQGEIVRADAIRAALPDYMHFPALREMHQLSAAGTTLEAEVGDDGTTQIVAHVVDPVAVAKVKNKVYRGFSIGGRITQRDADNPKAITGLVLSEISLVDRPANPEAVFDCWKAAAMSGGLYCAAGARPAPTGSAREPFNPPIQIWACGVPAHHHRAKSEAVKCLEIRALEPADSLGQSPSEGNIECSPQSDQEAMEADAAIAEAGGCGTLESPSRDEMGELVSGTTIRGNIWDPGRAARIIRELDWLGGALEAERAVASGNPQEMARMRGNIAGLRGLLHVMVAEGIGPIPSDAQVDDSGLPNASELVAGVVGARGPVRIAGHFQTGNENMHKPASRFLAKAGQPQADQVLLDMALYACDNCLEIDGLPVGESEHIGSAREHLVESGAGLVATASADAASDAVKLIAKPDRSCSRAHQNLMDIAHECVCKIIEGMAWPPSRSNAGVARAPSEEVGKATKTELRYSGETREHLRSAHRDLVAAGARCRCDAESAAESQSRSSGVAELEKVLPAIDIAKVLADERAEKAALVKALGEVVPMLDRLSKRIDDIACTPLPPLTIARNSVAISKQQDGGGTADSPTIARSHRVCPR